MTEDQFVEVYREISKVSELVDAQILSIDGVGRDANIAIEASWRSRDLGRLNFQYSRGHYLVKRNHVTTFPLAPEADHVVLQKLSPSGNQRARIIQNDQLRFLQVIGPRGEITSIDLREKNQHGKVYCDPYISCLEWSHDETKLAYVAEQKTPKGITYYQSNTDKEAAKGEKYLYKDDWGEQMIGQHKGVVVSLDLRTRKLTTLPLPEDLTPGELVWIPDTYDLIGVANVSRPFKIGLAYCSDRESLLFKITLDGKYEELTDWGSHVKCPRIEPTGTFLIYQKSFIFGNRAPAAQLWKMNLKDKKEEMILEYVNNQQVIASDSFPGLCGKTFVPSRCFDVARRRILVSAFKLSSLVLYVIDLETKSVCAIGHTESCIILDIFEDWMLIAKTSITEPKRLYLTKLPETCENYSLDYIPISSKKDVCGIGINWYRIFEYPSPTLDLSGNSLTLSALYFGPTVPEEGKKKRPLICWPHGGPHSITANAFNYFRAFFIPLGYSIVFPNYRGSVGHGNDFLSSSLGQCGVADVEDCYLSIQECFQRFPDVLDESKIFLIGISHGGFLAGHLTSQYPDRFKAACILNPAVDIYTMATASDIPEWAFLEYGLSYNIGRSIDKEAALRMFQRSPVHNVEKVRAPTLVCLGSQDARVPPSQGINYHRLLIANNIPTRLYVYEDNHPLLKISSESDYVVQIAKWFQKYG